jgi:hypothetical protein
MRRLRPTDGTLVHRRAAVYHIARCTTGGTPLHATLRNEMELLLDGLKSKAREAEDFDDADVAAMATADAAEIALENVIRDADADLAKLDRANPALNAQRAVFPEGFGQMIDPEGDAQLTVLPALKVRFAAFKAHPEIAAQLVRLNDAEAAFTAALKAGDTADTTADALFAEEQAARLSIRVQLESAYGRLRDLYKTRPALAEAFFLKESGSRRAKKETAIPTAPAAPPKAPPIG